MGREEGRGREGKREGRKGRGGENDFTHPLSQIPGYAAGRRGREEGKGEGRKGGRALSPTVSSNNANGHKGYADIRWGSAG